MVSFAKYALYSFASNVFISAESVLSTHSMLSVIGCADTTVAMTTTYIGKDIIGQIGGLVYMYSQGKKADQEPRKFLSISHALQQGAVIVECASPFVAPWMFLPIAGIAGTAKNISFTGFGAINAKCIQKLADSDNIGELYAKLSAINTVGSSVGMILGLYLIAKFPLPEQRLAVPPLLGLARVTTFHYAVKNILDV